MIILLGVLAVLMSGCTMPYVLNADGTATAIIRQVTEISGTLQTTPTPANTATLTPTSGFDSFSPSATPEILPTFQHLTPSPRPPYYILQPGEFPYCIARRFDVDPKELLTLNGLSSGMLYSPGLVLTIPQTGKPFPAPRWLLAHPVTYTVMQQTTVYRLACQFGDVDPIVIMQINSLTSPILSLGQTISIP
ncbi:MAG: LysM peptidoglycan-binding domain-containing protein [Chloroflexota bacterium]